MFKMGRAKPRKCKWVSGFGENAQRCDNYINPRRGEGATHCDHHLEEEAANANNHPAYIPPEDQGTWTAARYKECDHQGDENYVNDFQTCILCQARIP